MEKFLKIVVAIIDKLDNKRTKVIFWVVLGLVVLITVLGILFGADSPGTKTCLKIGEIVTNICTD